MPATRRRCRPIGALAAIVFAGSAGLLPVLQASSGAALAPAYVTLGAPAPLPVGATAIGPVRPGSKLLLQFVLPPRSATALAAEVASVTTPGSSGYRHFLAKGAFARRYGATAATLERVQLGLEHLGLPAGQVNANHLAVAVDATAGAAERALHTRLWRYRLPSGAVVTDALSPPRLPIGFGSLVSSVDGLDSLADLVPEGLAHLPAARGTDDQAIAHAVEGHGVPVPSASCETEIQETGAGYTPDEIASAYNMDGLYGAGDDGAGTTIGVIEFSSYSQSDLATYAACFAATPDIEEVHVDGGPGNADSDSVVEAELDLEDLLGLVPGAKIIVYEGPNDQGEVSNSAAYDTYAAAINADATQVLTTSWGTCEAAINDTDLDGENTLFEQAALQGQSVIAAAGDSGSEDCDGTLPGAQGQQAAVDDPASQPFVTGVGGTTLTLSPARSEVVWNTGPDTNDAGAGGGGDSSKWPMPLYQRRAAASVGVRTAPGAASACTRHGSCREVPDLAANAGSPYAVYCTIGLFICGRSGWTSLGGTSAAAPTVAAIVALADASSACTTNLQGPIGFLNPELYAIAGTAADATAFNDITSGDNDLTGANHGLFAAAPGYDLASGLGSPDAGDGEDTGLVAELCSPTISAATAATSGLARPSLTELAPATGRTSGGLRIALTGKGLEGATAVRFGATVARSFRVVSATEVLAVLPAGTGRVHVRVTTRAGTSKALRTNVFTYVVVPTIVRLAPPSGASSGGTVVVIGSGFTAAATVTFGGKPATSVVRRSATRLVVGAPAGSGTVAVVVDTAGGRATSTYTYS